MRLVVVVLMLFQTVSSAQGGFLITYSYDDRYPLEDGQQKKINMIQMERLVVNDSFAFWYLLTHKNAKKNGVYGNKALHHSIFYDRKDGMRYEVSAWPKNQPVLLIKDTLRTTSWVTGSEKRNILGFECTRAWRVTGINDTVVAYFTYEIPVPVGPNAYYGLPGLPLEVYDLRKHKHVVATKIERGDYRIALPSSGKIVSIAEFRRLRQKK